MMRFGIRDASPATVIGVFFSMVFICLSVRMNASAQSRVPAAGLHVSKQAHVGRILRADPASYLASLQQLEPGDTLLLQPGEYQGTSSKPGLPLYHLHGEEGRQIIITGPEDGPRPVFLGQRGYNTVRIGDTSYVTLRRLELDGRGQPGIDAIKSDGVSHHIVLEGLEIRNHNADQGDVGISTKAPAWDWVIRGTFIHDVGTGMYLGNSDGSAPFIRGLIECNVVADVAGYDVQIKHQKTRPDLQGIPTQPGATIVRFNNFSKEQGGSRGHMARPNLLVGHFPPSGPGSDDIYEIYGNLFFQNPTRECLFQGEGNIALYANLFFNSQGSAICIQPHNDVPRRIEIFHNTVVAREKGIRVAGEDKAFRQMVQGNAVFAFVPILAARKTGNIIGSFEAAGTYLERPDVGQGRLDLFPKPGKLKGAATRISGIGAFPDADRDFNGNPYAATFRGAYSGEGKNPRGLPGPKEGLCKARMRASGK